jgi:hypothetical protein
MLTATTAVGCALASAGGPVADAGAGHPYFPLAVGNSWSYRCSIEGEPRPGKVLRITGRTGQAPNTSFRAEMRVGKDPKPLVQYFSIDSDGAVHRSLSPDAVGDIVLAADVAPGSRHGEWVSAGMEPISVPSRRRLQAVRLENFSIDSPEVPAAKRNEWLARYYAKGIGPVAEADGLGGRCDLTSYRLSKPDAAAKPNG